MSALELCAVRVENAKPAEHADAVGARRRVRLQRGQACLQPIDPLLHVIAISPESAEKSRQVQKPTITSWLRGRPGECHAQVVELQLQSFAPLAVISRLHAYLSRLG